MCSDLRYTSLCKWWYISSLFTVLYWQPSMPLTGDHDDTDSSSPAQLNGASDLLTRGIQHTHAANKGQVSLRREAWNEILNPCFDMYHKRTTHFIVRSTKFSPRSRRTWLSPQGSSHPTSVGCHGWPGPGNAGCHGQYPSLWWQPWSSPW